MLKNEIFKIKGAAPVAPTDETCLTVAGSRLITRVTARSRGAGFNQSAWKRHRGGGSSDLSLPSGPGMEFRFKWEKR